MARYKCCSGARKCPNKKCRVSIEKNEGCAHMNCWHCKVDFCWCCFAVYDQQGGHGNKFWKLCPSIPYSVWANVLITLVVIAISPIAIPIMAFCGAFYGIAACMACNSICCESDSCAFKVLVAFPYFVLIVLPLATALSACAAALALAIGILPWYYCCIQYLVRLTYNFTTTQLC